MRPDGGLIMFDREEDGPRYDREVRETLLGDLPQKSFSSRDDQIKSWLLQR